MGLLEYLSKNIDEVSSKIPLSSIEYVLNLSFTEEQTGICREVAKKIIENRSQGIYFIAIIRGRRMYRILLIDGKIINAESLEMKEQVLTGKKVIEELNKLDTICKIMVYQGDLPLAVWRERFVFGIPEIDKVHEEMIDLLNKIIKAIIVGDIKSLDKLVKTLYDHTLNKHFKLEEDLMIKYNYPGYDKHLESHRMYIEVIEEMMCQAKNEDYPGLLTSILTLLESYLEYLEDEDRKMVRYIKGFMI